MKFASLFAMLSLFAAGVVLADPAIKFDDLPSDEVPVPSGYHGLNWSNIYYLNGAKYSGNPSGYQAGVVSGSSVLYSGGGNTGVITAEIFDFVSAYATSAWYDNLKLEAKGYIKGTLVYDQTNLLSATAPTLVNFNFYGVDEVDLTSSGGTYHAGYTGSGGNFVMDNVSVVTYLPYAAPLVPNGGFETGDFTDWNAAGSSPYSAVTNAGAFVHSGTHGMETGQPGTPWYLSQQVLPLGIGEEYTISFWFENIQAGQNNFTCYMDESSAWLQVGLTNLPSFVWTNLQFNFLSTYYSQLLLFGFQNNSSHWGFDDVSMAPRVLVTNGGFEAGSFAGWTQSGNNGYTGIGNSVANARSGGYGAYFGPSGSLGYISQTVTAFPAHPYMVSFWLNTQGGATPNEFTASWGGTKLIDQTNLTAPGWTNMHFTVMNTNAQNVLQFGFRDDPSELDLDEVSIWPMPLLQNGSFEFGDFTGWTLSSNFNLCYVTTNAAYTRSGFYGGQFGSTGSVSYLSQTVPTIPGQTYMVAYDLNIPSTQTNVEFKVSWNGTLLTDLINPNDSGWGYYSFLVTASAATSTLQFGFRDDPSYLGMDEVAVWAVSPPVIQSITRSAKSFAITWSSMPVFRYQLQFKTNLAQANWNRYRELSGGADQ